MSEESPTTVIGVACVLLAFGLCVSFIGIRSVTRSRVVVGRRSQEALRVDGSDARAFGAGATTVGALLVIGSCVLIGRARKELI